MFFLFTSKSSNISDFFLYQILEGAVVAVNSNLIYSKVYLIQNYVIKFVCLNITEILLKVALNTINQPTNQIC